MVITRKTQSAGGKAVYKKHGSAHMSRIGKAGRKKQLQEQLAKAI